MSALADQQCALLDALLQPRPPATTGAAEALGLNIYRANAHAHAERALAAAFPVVCALLGDGGAVPLARALWHHAPPGRGDLAQWGDALPGFIGAEPAFADMPWLPDVARIEWAVHRAHHADGRSTDAATFERLVREDPDQLHLILAPGTAVITSRWPVLAVIEAHQPGGPDLAVVGERLRTESGESVRVWRQGWAVRTARLAPDDAAFEQSLLDGLSLGVALERSPTDIGRWLPQAVGDGLLLGVEHRPVSTDPLSGEIPCRPPA